MNIEELKKELEKFKSVREKVLRLNEITKFTFIIFGLDYINLYNGVEMIRIMRGIGGCMFCGYDGTFTRNMRLKVKNCNDIDYYPCHNCKDKTLCAYCLCEKENCTELTKKKITFWLCTKNIFPKDIRKFIIKLFFVKLNFIL